MFLGTLVALHGVLALGLGVLSNGDLIKAKSLRQFQIYFISLTLAWAWLYLNGSSIEVGWLGLVGYLPFFLSYEVLLSAVCLHAAKDPRRLIKLFLPVVIVCYLVLVLCDHALSLYITDTYQALALLYCWNLCRSRSSKKDNIGDKYLANFMLLGASAFVARSACMYFTESPGSGYAYTAIVFTLVNVGMCLSIMASYFVGVKIKLVKQANTDSLTNVYNRRYFSSNLNQTHASSCRRSIPYSVIICDIDLFKSVNDTYGHTAGDLALVRIAKELTKVKRTEDTLSRYGGEEFIFLLPDTDLEEAESVALRLKDQVEKLVICTGKKSFGVTMSFGVAKVHANLSPSDVIENADEALLLAKGNGRNRICVSEAGIIRACTLQK